jgi:hypothetical protein
MLLQHRHGTLCWLQTNGVAVSGRIRGKRGDGSLSGGNAGLAGGYAPRRSDRGRTVRTRYDSVKFVSGHYSPSGGPRSGSSAELRHFLDPNPDVQLAVADGRACSLGGWA